ncbi:unnamed protein product [Orchesella dallaii]|uniref:Uncharacterized protein n=1 Tax=Orchesella dallaii TaxID=48710 RepID=A0ABP1PP49_9HEXA
MKSLLFLITLLIVGVTKNKTFPTILPTRNGNETGKFEELPAEINSTTNITDPPEYNGDYEEYDKSHTFIIWIRNSTTTTTEQYDESQTETAETAEDFNRELEYYENVVVPRILNIESAKLIEFDKVPTTDTEEHDDDITSYIPFSDKDEFDEEMQRICRGHTTDSPWSLQLLCLDVSTPRYVPGKKI